jgi:hypothetical protein
MLRVLRPRPDSETHGDRPAAVGELLRQTPWSPPAPSHGLTPIIVGVAGRSVVEVLSDRIRETRLIVRRVQTSELGR